MRYHCQEALLWPQYDPIRLSDRRQSLDMVSLRIDGRGCS